jgi:hypothetical protein
VVDATLEQLEGHVILTGADGALRTPPEEVDAMVAAMVGHGRGVLHFHGGLVSEPSGLRIARDLRPVYEQAGAYPIFVVWRSDFLSIVRGNLYEIAREEVFNRLVRKVLSYVAGKAGDELVGGGKGDEGATVLSEYQVNVQLARLDEKDEVPFAELVPREGIPELSEDELADFEEDVESDVALNRAVAGAVATVDAPSADAAVGKGDGFSVPARPSLLDPEAAAELRLRDDPAKGLVTTAALVRKAVRVLLAVIGRFRAGRGHGVYATVVEEVLREFYLGNAGAAIWSTMKRETHDTFNPSHPQRGGNRVLSALVGALPNHPSAEITLVGHSTGAVYIDNLLGAVDQRRRDAAAFLADFTFRNVVFLAPACTFSDFDRVLRRREHLWRDFRLFTMTDQAERADRLVPVLYPHSLLYLVSGLLERDAQGNSEGGKPLVGLQRWHARETADDDPPELQAVVDMIRERPTRAVWSPVEGPPGCSAGARSHGAFDDDPLVRESLRVLISGGA